jgi:oligo-1,6-glucosidase
MALNQDVVVYQIYPRSFKDSNGDGIGDIQGIISKLDYIKSLGVDVLWLSPVYQSPNDDNGYDISDYKNINPEYGTMMDMHKLIIEAGLRGIKIIMDLVINHTSDEHEWFIKSKAKDPKYRNYYIWKDEPNNWTSFFGGKAWTKVDDSYYLHLFSKKQPDLNWKNPDVMDEIKDVMKFWLDKGIYGFRCDVINIIFKSSLKNGKKRLVLIGKEHYHQQDGMHVILKKLRKDILDHYETFTVGETVMVTPKQANDLIMPVREELDMVFSFAHMEVDQINNKWFKRKFKPIKLMRTLTKWQNEVYWNANYFENHDQPRSVSRFGNDKEFHDESSKMLGTLLFGLKGTPYIYQGQEIGMTNCPFNDMSEFKDVETHRIYEIAKKIGIPRKMRFNMMLKTSRDNARTPMQWSNKCGFTTGKPWLKMNPNCDKINVLDQETTAYSILNYYRKLIQLRKKHHVLRYGTFESLYEDKSVYIFRRFDDEHEVYVMCNFSNKSKKIKIEIGGELLISNINKKDYNHILSPYEARMYIKEI